MRERKREKGRESEREKRNKGNTIKCRSFFKISTIKALLSTFTLNVKIQMHYAPQWTGIKLLKYIYKKLNSNILTPDPRMCKDFKLLDGIRYPMRIEPPQEARYIFYDSSVRQTKF